MHERQKGLGRESMRQMLGNKYRKKKDITLVSISRRHLEKRPSGNRESIYYEWKEQKKKMAKHGD